MMKLNQNDFLCLSFRHLISTVSSFPLFAEGFQANRVNKEEEEGGVSITFHSAT